MSDTTASSTSPSLSNDNYTTQKMSTVLGVIVIARNGDRQHYYQDPNTYAGAATQTTALGEVESYQLGALLRSTYLSNDSPSFIDAISTELVDNKEIHVRVKGGGEGTVVFDSAIALLQGLFPPNKNNKITLANETTVTAPLGGYQYVPVETVEPGNDRSLESWTNCPNFEKHVADFYKSDEFKKREKDAEPFFNGVRDYIFGRPATLANIWNIYDYINSELTHNRTYAHRLPPTFKEQAQALADFHENGVFSDGSLTGIGNIAGRTLLHTILSSLQRIAYNGDPLQFLLVETTYQPFISLFHQTDIVKEHPELKAIPNYASSLAIELRRGSPPDLRDFLRFRFKNGTSGDWETLHVFGHKSDIPLTEFIYRIESSAITSNKQWSQVCGAKSSFIESATSSKGAQSGVMALFLIFGLFILAHFVKRSRARKTQRQVRLEGDEETPILENVVVPLKY